MARAGLPVVLFEMKPGKFSPAHKSEGFAELVCSNSLRSNDPLNAAGLLKEEMRKLGSLVMESADMTSVPAGKALAVDRRRFSDYITEKIRSHPLIKVVNKEVTLLDQILEYNEYQNTNTPEHQHTIISTGPLTSEAFSREIAGLIGCDCLYFYDSVAPIVDASTIDFAKGFKASRYGYGGDDYWNFPLSGVQYRDFLADLDCAERVKAHDFEDPLYFEGCLPIEVMAERGPDTLRHGPMKPFGLVDPSAGREPYAVVQLRQEDSHGTMLNMVGFQTRMTWSDQKRIFQKFPGFGRAKFLRFGVIHRNTYINSPRLLDKNLEFIRRPGIFFAGQITGVEGYIESAATGLSIGLYLGNLKKGHRIDPPPATTALGSLVWHVVNPNHRNFQPMNVNFGLMPIIKEDIPKNKRKWAMLDRARADFEGWLQTDKPH